MYEIDFLTIGLLGIGKPKTMERASCQIVKPPTLKRGIGSINCMDHIYIATYGANCSIRPSFVQQKTRN